MGFARGKRDKGSSETKADRPTPAMSRKPAGDVRAAFAEATAGGAVAVPHRARMEAGFGESFAGVRVHLGGAAPLSRIAAAAAASDEHIAFANRAPTERQVAHELAHVVQQRRHSRTPAGLREVSQPGDAAEREADAAARAVSAGAVFRVQQAPTALVARDSVPVAAGSGWFPSQQTVPPGTPPPWGCFENSATWTAAGAPKEFDKFLALSLPEREQVLVKTYASGALSKSLAALGLNARLPKYADVVREILRWIEENETRKTTGKNDAEMAKVQAGFIKADPKVAAGNWGGEKTTAASPKTRWGGLLEPAQKAWEKRAVAAITKVVAYASVNAPELQVTAASFEFEPEKVDASSKAALGTGGSKPGENMRIGFEFVAMVEVNPAYVLQIVAHELYGHPVFNGPTKRTYQGDLFTKAAALAPAGTVTDPTGTQTFNYYASELYSWLLMIPYAKTTDAGDVKKEIESPDGKRAVTSLNYDPVAGAEGWLTRIKSKWEPSLVVGLVRGLYQRVRNDPTVKPLSKTTFATIIKKVFPSDHATILK